MFHDRNINKKINEIQERPLRIVYKAVAPPGFFIGGEKQDGVWGGAPESFSWTTPSTLALDATNALFID